MTGKIIWPPFRQETASDSDSRRVLYAQKITNEYWFDGELPKDRGTGFVIYWSKKPSLNEHSIPLESLLQLSEDDLRYICSRLVRPDWVDSPESEHLSLLLGYAALVAYKILQEYKDRKKKISRR